MTNHNISANQEKQIQIGRRIQLYRKYAGITLKDLANEMGISAQQINKYEKGINCVKASTLVEIADIIGVDVMLLIKNPDDTCEDIELKNESDPTTTSDRDLKALNQAFMAIEDKKLRKGVLKFIENMSNDLTKLKN